jgi:Uma2 family endonuclease
MANAAPQWFERPLTHRDLDDLPENDGERYEVIDGELYVSPFPFIAHQQAASELFGFLWAYLERQPLGRVFTSNTKIVLDEPTGVSPDVVFISSRNPGALRQDGFYGAPDLMVEVTSSKPNLDRVIKYRKYAAAGVPHYWIVDPMDRTLEAFELGGGRYHLAVSARGDETFSPALFPGLSIPLGRLWG